MFESATDTKPRTLVKRPYVVLEVHRRAEQMLKIEGKVLLPEDFDNACLQSFEARSIRAVLGLESASEVSGFGGSGQND